MNRKNRPFDHNYFIGYVSQVFPDFARVHFPSSVLLNKFIFSGEEFNAGLVGNYVTIEGENHGFFGKILELSLPEKERLSLNERDFQSKEFHPAGRVEILLSFDYFNPEKVSKGLSAYPNIGAKVFVCPSSFIQKYFVKFGATENSEETDDRPVFDFGVLISDNKTSVSISQQALFGRHCAIVGTTGGGKSWTVSKCLTEIIDHSGKAILIDATGEYSTFDGQPKVTKACIMGEDSFFHYSNLTVEDIFVLLRPSQQAQSPKLLEAITSLKLLKCLENKTPIEGLKINDGTLVKNSQPKKIFYQKYNEYIAEIEDQNADFDITKLSMQIKRECVYDANKSYINGKQEAKIDEWGDIDNNAFSNCSSLVLRTNHLINSMAFKKVFGFSEQKTSGNELTKQIDSFLKSDSSLMRISFEKVGYEFQAREILANAIGKHLLMKARKGDFKEEPLILFIDEAHQYLNKNVKDEYFESVRLSSYDQIAKECRKYGLFLCLATQMPRDIPVGTLSQMGTFIVHRLINQEDKKAIENACSSASSHSLSFLPVLGEGEAILTGVDFPMPVAIKVKKPRIEPNSRTPKFRNLPVSSQSTKNEA